MKKSKSRIRRARRTRAKIKELGVHRLSVHRTPRHIYAQVIGPDGGTVIASASTVVKDISGDLKYTGNIEAAAAVGKAVAEKTKAAGITRVAFDRSGFRYHGRVKALAEAARENGLEF
ncbi:MAG: 50S ribosomal protein L18 [Gammaproteobacteria bacterium]|jgi:large subunit ribosomal protein L18|nr:50S ribosomal protein L18 [Chromatiales bacterium]MCP4925799.1 50S ribosomal protein L18 [Gammaproteobacteria bacterium]MDP7154365.1 50S ribosomal protein L18 [Gammaproteobacteria bacterium]MDP7419694.1 50S ribosomal protein L18 [Gammaproteobacteria bacterium]HJP37882.1 50S ribosomal protein L18 [Gammaproteobacteria bacterium]